MGRALVLNVTDLPLAVVPARRAVVLVLKEKAEVVASNGAIFRSERIVLEAPSVVRLRTFVHVPVRTHAPLTRRAVFARDGWECQYCGAPAENLDHVLPRSRAKLPAHFNPSELADLQCVCAESPRIRLRGTMQ